MSHRYAIVFAFILACSSTNAQWRQTNGPDGAAILSFIGRGDLLLANTQRGLYRSIDGGGSWNYVEGIVPYSINVMFYADSVVQMMATSTLLSRSTDNGATWSGVMANKSSSIAATRLANGKLILGSRDSTCLSTDDGATWRRSADSIYQAIGIRGFLERPGKIFAATYSSGMWVSTDGGEHWRSIRDSLDVMAVSSIVFNDGAIFAMSDQGKLWRSTDEGVSWRDVTNGVAFDFFPQLKVHRGSLYQFGTVVRRSTDNGATWTQITPMTNEWIGTGMRNISFRGDSLIVGRTTRGVWYTTDNGTTWGSLNIGLELEITGYDIQSDGNTLVTNGGTMVVSRDNGHNWITTDSAFGPTYNVRSFGIRAMIGLPGELIMLTNSKVMRSSDGGSNWIEIGTRGLSGREIFNAKTFFGNLYVTSDSGMTISTDRGATWTPWRKTPSRTDPPARLDTVGTRMVMLTLSSKLYSSSDLGFTWERLSFNTPQGSKPYLLASTPAGLFIGSERLLQRSTDFGATWRRVDSTLPPDESALALTQVGSTLFVGMGDNDGSQYGVRSSIDSGLTWQKQSEGMEGIKVYGLTKWKDDLLAGSYYYGVWRRPLSELGVILSTPFDPVRNRSESLRLERDGDRVRVHFHLNASADVALSIVDIVGRVSITTPSSRKAPGDHSIPIDLSELPTGSYVLAIAIDSSVLGESFSITR